MNRGGTLIYKRKRGGELLKGNPAEGMGIDRRKKGSGKSNIPSLSFRGKREGRVLRGSQRHRGRTCYIVWVWGEELFQNPQKKKRRGGTTGSRAYSRGHEQGEGGLEGERRERRWQEREDSFGGEWSEGGKRVGHSH